MIWTKFPSVVVMAVALLLLAGCGGGSGSSDSGGSQGVFSLNASTLTLDAAGYLVPAPTGTLSGTVSGLAGKRLFIKIVVTGQAVARVDDFTFQNASSGSSGTAVVTATDPTLLGAGSYQGTITVYACTSDISCQTGQLAGSPATVNVTYNITGIKPSQSALNYAITNASSTLDDKISLSVAGFPDQAWTAAIDIPYQIPPYSPWLKLSATTGDTSAATPLDVSLDESAGPLPNDIYKVQVTLTPTNGNAVMLPVIATIDRTELDFVSPHGVPPNESAEAVIHGAHFDANAITGVSFGGISATSYSVVSANEIRATYPSLGPGSYTVTLAGAASTAATLAKLEVVSAPHYSPQSVPLTFLGFFAITDPHALIFDAVNQRLVVAGTLSLLAGQANGDQVYAYQYSGSGTWPSVAEVLSGSAIYDVALSADGEWMQISYVDSGGSGTVVNSGLSGGGFGAHVALTTATTYVKKFAVASDGKLVMISAEAAGGAFRPAWTQPTRPTYSQRSLEAPPILQLSVSGVSDPNLFYDGSVGASLDGSRVLLASSTSSPGTTDIFSYEPRTGQLLDTGKALKADSIQMDRTGSRILLSHMDLYDGSFNLIGNLPAATLVAALSPDGAHVFVYQSDQHIKKFNATTLAQEADWVAVASAGNPQGHLFMTCSPDGGNLFIVGSDALVVELVQ